MPSNFVMKCLGALDDRGARRLVLLLQLFFLGVALPQLGEPFVSYHYERQNQTYDMADHVFREGWPAVVSPRTSFSLPGYEARPFTVARQEFPFHGLLGWPLVKLFGHGPAVVRIVSLAFALGSIQLLYLILRLWLPPRPAVGGTALWALSPMLLHFGQVPMPDILCTTGMLAAFWFASRKNSPASSACFLFAVLAKISVVIFGLPVLVALLVAGNCKNYRELIGVSVLWGSIPLAGLIGWTALEFIDPDTPWTVVKILHGRGGIHSLIAAKYYAQIMAGLIPYGLGVIGALGCLAAMTKKSGGQIQPAVKWALLAANFLYLVLVDSKIQEPQYLLPVLAWMTVPAAWGIAGLAKRFRINRWSLAAVGALICLQVVMGVFFTLDLKASRVPDFGAVEQAAKVMPPNARVLVAYPFYGASPAVWFHRNILAVNNVRALPAELPALRAMGYSYLVLMDVKTRTKSAGLNSSTHIIAAFGNPKPQAHTQRDAFTSHFTAPESPWRQFCDAQFQRRYVSDFVIVYALSSTNGQSR